MAINRVSPRKGKILDLPSPPTIGTASDVGGGSASVAFTPNTTIGGPSSSYTVT